MINEKLDMTALICEVLNHRALACGSSTITSLSLPNAALKAGIQGFQLRTSGLTWTRTEDLLLLDDSQIDKALSQIAALVAASKADSVLLACDPLRLGAPPASWGRLEVIEFSQLFQRLCAIPDALPELILTKARRDFNRTVYKERSQARLLRVLHSPDRGSELAHEEIPADEYFRDWARTDMIRHPVLLLGE